MGGQQERMLLSTQSLAVLCQCEAPFFHPLLCGQQISSLSALHVIGVRNTGIADVADAFPARSLAPQCNFESDNGLRQSRSTLKAARLQRQCDQYECVMAQRYKDVALYFKINTRNHNANYVCNAFEMEEHRPVERSHEVN